MSLLEHEATRMVGSMLCENCDVSLEREAEVIVDRRSINVLLATLDIEQRELAARMGYRPSYVVNVLTGFSSTSAGLQGGLRRARR